jgi:hypothetical protein
VPRAAVVLTVLKTRYAPRWKARTLSTGSLSRPRGTCREGSFHLASDRARNALVIPSVKSIKETRFLIPKPGLYRTVQSICATESKTLKTAYYRSWSGLYFHRGAFALWVLLV